MPRWSGWIVVATFMVAAAYDLVLGLRHSTSSGPDALGFLAMLISLGLVFSRTLAATLLAPAAGLFVTARFYTQDPSYSGFHRAFAENGIPRPSFVFVLLALSFAAGATTYRWRLPGAFASAVVLVVLMVTALFVFGAGY